MGTHHHIQVHLYLMCVVHSITSLVGIGSCADIPLYSNKESINPDTIGGLPCFQKHLLRSYYDKHDGWSDLDFQGFLALELCSPDSCKGFVDDLNSVLSLSVLQRHLIGEGSHRRLLSSMKFDNPLGAKSMLSVNLCEAIIIERLPSGVYADPFELQHLVQRGVFVDAAVFGDTNLELPSALSNRSVVEVHVGISHNLISRHDKGFEISIELPLHARYPPLDGNGGGYTRVEMNSPELLLRCRRGNGQHKPCLWMSIPRDKESMSDKEPFWQIPSGSISHSGIVSYVTFVSAFASFFLIVFAARSYSTQTHDAITKDC